MKAKKNYPQVKTKLFNYFSLVSASLLASLLVFSILSISSLQAATQGTAGPSSSGTVEINIVRNRLIIIQGLRDFNFGVWNTGDGTLVDNDNVCVGKTNFGTYGIRAAGNGNGLDPAAFTLSNGVDQINYNVYWNDATGTAGNQQLTPGVILHGQNETFFHTFFFFFGFCGNNANLQIEIPDTELQASSGGYYSGTLTLLVIPD